jgi:hypothetical protein
MIIIAVIAVDIAVLLLRRPAVINAIPIGAMPMADVLAVLLATIVGRLRRRGEAPLSHVMFLLAGGMALVFLIYLVQLRPDLDYGYLRNTAGRLRGEYRLVGVLLDWLALSVPILVPALIVGWATRGYRLKLTTRIDGQSEVASRDWSDDLIQPPVAPGEPCPRGEAGREAAVPGPPAIEQGLRAQGVVRPALGLQPARTCAAALRELEERPEVAAAEALPVVRPDG